VIQIVVLPMRWVVVGRVAREGQDVVIRDASVIRRWGTRGKGLGGLAYGPLPARNDGQPTVLDPVPTVRVHMLDGTTPSLTRCAWAACRIASGAAEVTPPGAGHLDRLAIGACAAADAAGEPAVREAIRRELVAWALA
jgi:hypothetical protein